MGRINNGNWVNQHRKIQGKFQNKQDIEAYLFDKKLSNGNNIQGENRLNTDDLPNIPAMLDYETNLSRQNIIEPIDGGKAHTPTTQAFLTALTALSVISPNITASSKKAISTDSQNSLSRTVKSFTEIEMSKPLPVLFDTTAATTSTSQNHDESQDHTTHNDNQSLIRVKREQAAYDIFGNLLCIHNAWLDTKIVKHILKENSNITKLKLKSVWGIDSQKAQEMATILNNSNINTMSFEFIDITSAKELMAVLKYTNITVLQLANRVFSVSDNVSSNSNIPEIVKGLKDTNVETLIFTNNYIEKKLLINIIKSLKEFGSKVKTLALVNVNISDKEAEEIASEIRDTQITKLDLSSNPISGETLQKISMVLEDNRHVNEDSYTSTMESSTTKEESSKDISGKQEKKEDLTTPKGNIIEKSEPIAEDSITTKSSVVNLITLAVSIIGAIGGTVVYVTKKFFDGQKSYTHDDLALGEPTLDSHLDNNQDILLTGVVVDEGI